MAAHETRLDSEALKVLAHPLRSRLLGALRLEGPATATTLARALGTNTGATSYHLRRLAEVGLVEETSEGTGRERWWRAAHERHSFFASDVADAPDAEAARTWLQGEYLRQFQARLDAWHAQEAHYPLVWRDAAGTSDYALNLSPDRLTALLGELDAVIERYRTAGAETTGAKTSEAEPSGAEPSADDRRVFLVLHAFPDVAGGTA